MTQTTEKTVYYTVDLSDCNNYPDLHERFRQALAWPDYYGRNWDAFWDCLSGGFTYLPGYIRITGVGSAGPEVQDAIPTLREILRRAKEEYDTLDYSIEC